MLDANDLLITIKKAAMEAVAASKPVIVTYGKVIKTVPLEISIEQKLQLEAEFLVVTNAAKEAALAAGDEVVLIRQQGGQKYIVVDKVVDAL